MKREGLPAPRARRIYDRLAVIYPLVERFEGRVKAHALELLDLPTAQHVLDVGVGPGGELAAMRAQLAPDAHLVGIDISVAMLRRARRYGTGPILQANAAYLPFRDRVFDRLFAAYVLDLLPPAEVNRALAEFYRVLAPGGRAVVVAMTEGITAGSRLLIAVWKGMYTLSPSLCAGCRPLRLSPSAEKAGFRVRHKEVVVEFGFPSEVLVLEHRR